MDQDVKDILVDGDAAPSVDVKALITKATAQLKGELDRERSEKTRLGKIALERDQAAVKAQTDLQGMIGYTARAEHSAISNALAAADAEAATMKADLASAIETADGKRAADLAGKIGELASRRETLERGKEKIEEEIERARVSPPPAPKPQVAADPYEAMLAPLPENQKLWLRQHKDKGYVAPGREPSAKMMRAYYDAREAGLREDSPAFTAHMDKVLGHGGAAPPAGAAERFQERPAAPAQQPQQAKRGGPVPAAPPSRGAATPGNGNGPRYVLTRDQHQTAQRMQMTDAEYVKFAEVAIKRGKNVQLQTR